MIPLAVSEVITAITADRNTKYVLNLGRRVKGSSTSLAITMAGASLHKVSLLAPGHQELPRVARSRSLQTRTLLLPRPTVLTQPPTPNQFAFPASNTLQTGLLYSESGACLRGLTPRSTEQAGRSVLIFCVVIRIRDTPLFHHLLIDASTM